MMKRNMVGKLICVIQLIFSATLMGVIYTGGMVPLKYQILAGVILLVLLAGAFGLQFLKNKAYLGGIVISVLVSIGCLTGIFYLLRADSAMQKIGGATYKTDNMVVVVKQSCTATELKEAGNYRFGKQTAADQDNTNLMVDKIQEVVGREINITDYASVQDLAQALLKGEIEAAIYNEAFDGILNEAIEGYTDQVKILYQYGIDTKLNLEKENTVVDDAQPYSQDTFSFYISGIDVSGPITTNSRSDVNIIATVNTKTKQILLTTTPRDYYVPLPNVSGGLRDKLTHAGIYGVDVSMDTLGELYGIDIQYYARVNFTSLIKMVDTLGGIDVYSEYAFEARGCSFNKGMNHMNGEQALAFARERYSFEAGDNQRGKNQEAVLTAMIRKAMTPAVLTHANELLAQVSDSMETNMTQEEMASLIKMQLNDNASWNIVSTNVVGTGDKTTCFSMGSMQVYVMWPDENSVAQISQKMKQVLNGETITE